MHNFSKNLQNLSKLQYESFFSIKPKSNFSFFQVTFSAKLDPAEKVTFHLRYEELLQRSDQGKYHYSINIQPQNQKIADFKIKVNINESLPLNDISVSRQSYRYQELQKVNCLAYVAKQMVQRCCSWGALCDQMDFTWTFETATI